MRKRGYTWLLSDPGHLPVSIGTLNPPVYWVGPGGYRFQATGHNGRGKLTGPAGAVMVFDLLARWNDTGYLALFPEEFREEIARDVGYQMSRRPFGGTITSMARKDPPLRHPLKLTGDPNARYEELPAALPMTTRFLDLNDEFVRAHAAGNAYDGWRHAVHVLLSEGLDCGGTAPLTPELVSQVRDIMGSDALEVLGAAFHRAALAGAADYDRLAEEQLDRYATGLGVEVPLDTPPVISLSNTVHARQQAGKPAPDPEELNEIASREGYGIGKKHRAGAIVLGIGFDPAQLNVYLRYAHQEQS